MPPTLWLQIPLCLHPFTLPIPYRFATGTDCSRHLCLIHTSHMAPTHILTLIIFKLPSVQFSSVQSLMSDSLRPHRLQHDRLPCPSPFPGVCSDLCPLIWWYYPTISVLCCPLLLSVFPSIRVFSSESVLHIRWPKYWTFSFSISPPNEYSVSNTQPCVSLRVSYRFCFSGDPWLMSQVTWLGCGCHRFSATGHCTFPLVFTGLTLTLLLGDLSGIWRTERRGKSFYKTRICLRNLHTIYFSWALWYDMKVVGHLCGYVN